MISICDLFFKEVVALCLVKDPGKGWNLLKHTFFKDAKSLVISVKK